jgi:hypothetical protein
MDVGTAGKCRWRLDGGVCVLDGQAIAGRVDVSHPERGVEDVRVSGYGVVGERFCVYRAAETATPPEGSIRGALSWPLAVAESYIRGPDLVASYQASIDWPYSPQIYWRADPLDSVRGVVGSVSLLVSVQTHLLDTFPRIVVGSAIEAADAIQLSGDEEKPSERATIHGEFTTQSSTGVCGILWRLNGSPFSYAEFMPASDFRTARAWRQDDGRYRVEWQIFAEFLEKGVIRRARVYGVFLRREDDVQSALACRHAIERESLPLTT